MEIRNVSIIGLGALGVMYADFFTNRLGKEKVRVLADRDRIKRYSESRITCNGRECDFQYADIADPMEPADLLIFAVKYGGLQQAIRDAAPAAGENTLILSVLNGVSSEEDLIEAFGEDKVLFCVAQKMDALKDGSSVTYAHLGELAVGELDGRRSERLRRLTDFFDQAEFPYELPDDMKKHEWGKLLCNTGLNQTLMVYEGTFELVQKEGEARELMKGAMREVVAVANSLGIELGEADIDHWLEIINGLNPKGEPSMRQDARARRKSEVELFGGTICRLGRENNVPTPVNDFLYGRILEIEASY